MDRGTTMDRPLLEREEEIGELQAAVRSAHRGHGRLVVVEAHAGLGKSSLLAHSARRAGGAEVLRARGTPLATDFPFSVALQLAERGLRERSSGDRAQALSGAARLAAPLLDGSADVPASSPEDRMFSLVHGLFWLVANLAQGTALLLTVDDAHWADRPSLRFLHHLAQRIDELPICLIAAWRPGEPGAPEDLLTELRCAPDVTVLRPRPLSGRAVARLTTRRLPRADPAFCAACAERTGGNPLLVAELVAELERRGVQPDREGTRLLPDLVPAGVASTVHARLTRLPDAAVALIKAASVFGDDAPVHHAAALADLDDRATAAAVDALTGAGLLAADGGRLQFRHPLVAGAVRSRLGEGEAGLMHRRAAGLLHRAGAPAAVVAAQLGQAPARSERWAFEALSAAGRTAARDGVPSSAARWLRRALDEAPDRGARAAALAELAEIEIALGDAAGRQRLAEAVELEAEPARQARLLLELGRALTESGDLRAAADTLERARDLAGDDGMLDTEIEAAWVVAARHVPGLHDRAMAQMREMLGRPRPTSHGERVLLVAAANDAAFAGDHFARVLDLARRGLDGGRLLAEETSGGLTWTLGAAALGWADDFDGAQRLSEAALDDARIRGSVAGFAAASHARSYAALHTGHVAEAAADCRQGIDALPDPARTLLPFTCVQLTWAELERGEVDAAEEAIERFDPDARWGGLPVFTLIQQARGQVALARGRFDDGLRLLLESGELAAAARIRNPAVVPWRGHAVIAALGLERRTLARELAAEELALAERFAAPRALGAALRSAGLAERGCERGLELLTRAAATLEASAAALEHARTVVELGAAQRRSGSRAVARETLRRGLDDARRCGALALASRAEEELAAAGARRGDAPLRGPAALTPSELRVAGMAAGGMTNREIAQSLFVTVKAVQFHLRNVYRKLEIAGRDRLGSALPPAERSRHARRGASSEAGAE